MGTLIRFELRKILGNRAGMVACALGLALLVMLSVVNLASANWRRLDTGEVVTGFEAQRAFRDEKQSHAGLLTDERVAEDMEVLDRAVALEDEVPGFSGLSSEQVIDEYGLEFWQQTTGVTNQLYYWRVLNALEAAIPQATSLREGAAARLELDLENGSVSFSDAELEFWRGLFSQVSWPLEYGYADGWGNALAYMSFGALCIVALCIALSGVYAGEYQGGTAAVALPTRCGKRTLPVAKTVAALLFATAYWLLCTGLPIGINVAVCGADGWDLPLQVVNGFANPYPLTVGQTVITLYSLGYVVTLGIAAFTLFLSSRMRSTMPVSVIPMAITFLGLLGLFVGWQPVVKCAMLTPLSGLNYAFLRLISYAAGPVVADLPTVLALLYGAMLVVLAPLAMRSFRNHQVA